MSNLTITKDNSISDKRMKLAKEREAREKEGTATQAAVSEIETAIQPDQPPEAQAIKEDNFSHPADRESGDKIMMNVDGEVLDKLQNSVLIDGYIRRYLDFYSKLIPGCEAVSIIKRDKALPVDFQNKSYVFVHSDAVSFRDHGPYLSITRTKGEPLTAMLLLVKVLCAKVQMFDPNAWRNGHDKQEGRERVLLRPDALQFRGSNTYCLGFYYACMLNGIHPIFNVAQRALVAKAEELTLSPFTVKRHQLQERFLMDWERWNRNADSFLQQTGQQQPESLKRQLPLGAKNF